MGEISPRRFARPDLAWVAVTGGDRVRFLHALLTNDVQGLAVGEGNRNLLLTDKGKLTADCLLLVEDEQLLLGCAATAREGLLAALDHYLVADDVELEKIDLISHHLLGGDPPLAASLSTGELRHERPGEFRLVRRSLGSEPGWLILSEGELAERLATLPVGEPGEFEALRVAAGEPAWSTELASGVFPQEVGLGDCLHPLKGCYLGQETMVRIATQGQVKWQLVGLALTGGPAASGDPLWAPGEPGKKVGEVTSTATLPGTEQPVALARLRHEHALPGTQLVVSSQEIAATVVELPFVA